MIEIKNLLDTSKTIAKEIFENKKRHGFNTTDMNEEFPRLVFWNL